MPRTTRPSHLPPNSEKRWPDADTYTARPLLPLLPPPPPTAVPALPSAPRIHSFAATYTLSTHIVPAAHPRTPPHVPPLAPPADLDALPSAQRRRAVNTLAAETQTVRNSYESGDLGAHGSAKDLWIVANRYVRKGGQEDGRPGLTLVCTHAIGFCKEMWEPALDALLKRLAADPRAPRVDEIWAFDAPSHGDSALLNAGALSGLSDGADIGRDLLHFLLYYLPATCATTALPTHLTRLPRAVADVRMLRGVPARTLVGLGHSVGGVGMILPPLACPALFSALVLVDPPINPSYGLPPDETNRYLLPIVRGTLGRRASWPSADAAQTYFTSHPAYRSLPAKTLALYLATALHTSPNGEVSLKCTPEHETAMWETCTPFDGWACLPTLSPRVRLHWVLPRNETLLGRPQPGVAQSLVWRRRRRAGNVLLDAGHLIPMEKPDELGQVVAEFLEEYYGVREQREEEEGTIQARL